MTSKKPQVTLVLDNLRSIHNVGSILRTADGFGVTEVIYLGTTPYPKLEDDNRLPYMADKQTRQLHKTALGAELMLPGRYVESTTDLVKEMQENDVHICSLEQSESSIFLHDFEPPEKLYLVVGAEVTGVSSEILVASVTTIEIPMVGDKESYNVAVACGIALYHIFQA